MPINNTSQVNMSNFEYPGAIIYNSGNYLNSSEGKWLRQSKGSTVITAYDMTPIDRSKSEF